MIGYVFQTQCKQATHNANQQIHAPDRRCANRTTHEDMMDDSRLTATCIGTCFSLCKINSTSYSRAHMIIAATSDASWHLPVMTYHWYEEEERKGKRGTGERIRARSRGARIAGTVEAWGGESPDRASRRHGRVCIRKSRSHTSNSF